MYIQEAWKNTEDILKWGGCVHGPLTSAHTDLR